MLANIITNLHNNQNQSFTSRLPKGIFYDPKDIPHLRCAKCDCLMLSRGEEHAIMYKSLPLSNEEILNKVPDEIKKHMGTGYGFVKNLLNRSGISEVKRFFFENKDKAVIDGKTQKESKQIKYVLQQVFNITEKQPQVRLPEEQIIKNIEKIKTELPKETEELVDILLCYKKNNPKMSLKQIITNKKFFKHHEMFTNYRKEQFVSASKKHYEKIEGITKHLPEEEKKEISEINKSVYTLSKNKSMSDELRRALIQEQYSEFLNKITDSKVKKNLKKQIDKTPLEQPTGDYLFCRLHRMNNLNNTKIVKFIIYPLKNTFEHVEAKSLGGPDKKTNGIFMCSHCNHERGTTPYPIMMSVYPEFAENMQKQVSRLSTFIKKGALIGYDDYPQGIKRQIKQASGHEINIDRFIKDRKKMLTERIEQNKTKAQETNSALDKKTQKYEELQKRFYELQARMKSCNEQIKTLKAQKSVSEKQISNDIDALKNLE